jgi:2-aminobenzoate-CoA ligase
MSNDIDSHKLMALGRTAHVDTFCRDQLPAVELWPEMDWSCSPDLASRDRLNCAVELLDQLVANGDGERPALISCSGTWSYLQLLEKSNRIARVLVEDLGVEPGNRVLLRGPNTPMLAACWYATMKAGAVAVCTVSMLRPREIVDILAKAQIDLCLTDVRVASDCELAVESSGRANCRVVRFNTEEPHSLEHLSRSKTDAFNNCETAPDDVAIIAFTSGTTGTGKATMHFHRDLLVVCDSFSANLLKPDKDDIFCGTAPLAFTYALGGLLLFPARVGASVALLEQGSPSHLLDGIHRFRPSICVTSPTGYRAMLPKLGQFDVGSLKKCLSAGEPLPSTTFEAWREATGIQIIDGIGATEMLHIFISAAGDDIRPGSTGRVVPGYEARVVDENGQSLETGKIGRLAVRGPTGCRYLGDSNQQRRYVQNGWNITGDAYRMDADGYFWFQSRIDDIIVSSGYNISGAEIENVLLENPIVSECAVVGVPDSDRGMIAKAFVVLQLGTAPSLEVTKELQKYLKTQLAPYKYPRAIEFVETLPRTSTGKLQRNLLRKGAL